MTRFGIPAATRAAQRGVRAAVAEGAVGPGAPVPGREQEGPRRPQRFVRRFLKRVHCDERRFNADEVRSFLPEMREAEHARNTINCYHAALRFWFSTTLGRPEVLIHVPLQVPAEDRAPGHPDAQEVAVLLAVADPFYRTLFQTIYATGMGAREALNLRVEHIRSA